MQNVDRTESDRTSNETDGTKNILNCNIRRFKLKKKKKTRFALRRAYQRYLFMKGRNHKSDAFQVAIQLLVVTTREVYMRTQVVCAKRLNFER